MYSYIWPMVLILLSNTVYQICAKSVPEMNAFASLTVTYGVALIASFALFFTLGGNASVAQEYGKLNWVPFVFGLVLVGLEVGWIFAYKAGWQVSTGFIVQSAILAVILIAVGYVLYHEPLSSSKLIGIAICLVGLFFINR